MAGKRRAQRRTGTRRTGYVFYLIQYSYTPEAWRALVDGHVERDRARAVRELIQAFGGCLAQVRFPCAAGHVSEKLVTFGEHDVTAFAAFPSPIQAAAFSMAVSATGTVKSFRSTQVIPLEDGIAAMAQAGAKRKDASLSYRGPGEIR